MTTSYILDIAERDFGGDVDAAIEALANEELTEIDEMEVDDGSGWKYQGRRNEND